MTFKRRLMKINKSPRRISKAVGGRKKRSNPMANQLKNKLFHQKIKPSLKIYDRKKTNYD